MESEQSMNAAELYTRAVVAHLRGMSLHADAMHMHAQSTTGQGSTWDIGAALYGLADDLESVIKEDSDGE